MISGLGFRVFTIFSALTLNPIALLLGPLDPYRRFMGSLYEELLQVPEDQL